ncbi:MAG: hypothetical protein NTW91_08215 [Verrucomicrobia bacterium]|nr:hypothetical protein [Verrucomicrobiota bacterium]
MVRPSSSKRKDADRQSKARTVPRRRVQVATTAEAYHDLFDREALERDEFTRGQPRTTKATVPKSLVKFIVGIFLAPLAWVLTQTFFQAFTTSLHHGLLATQSFGCFAAGMLLFGILFTIVPRDALMLPYVFGHEVTHAIWVKLFGGKVADQFHVSLEGGHVLTDRVNTWIALAPYFFPIYSVLAATLYGVLALSARLIDRTHEGSHLTEGVDSLRWVLFLVLGLTLAFHLVFTFLLITKGQPDLHYGGTFFSLTVIYLINLLIITGLLLATSRSRICEAYWASLVTNSTEFLELFGRAAAWLVVWIQDFSTGLGK